AAGVGTLAHADDPPGFRHLFPKMTQAGSHLDRNGPGYNHEIGLAGTGAEDLRAEAGQVILGSRRGGDHLKATTGQRVHKRPDGAGASPILCPVEHVSDTGEYRRLFLLTWHIVLGSSCHAQGNRLAPGAGNIFLFSVLLLVTHLLTSAWSTTRDFSLPYF